ncbi:hypothetical protein [Emticicia sp.]|uniref:hypothetical protein n=1 Tax=Emticicia sp. TaxID=1930953 RepID=UPI0037500FD2
MYRLDRTAFRMGNHQEAEDNRTYWQSQSMNERLKAAMYLNSVAYNFDINNPIRIDKTAFNMRKHEN